MNKIHVHHKIKNFLDAVDALIELDKEVRQDYHHSHRSMVDIQHEIELSEDYSNQMKLNVFNHLKEIAESRRKSKDSILVLDALNKLLHNGTSLADLKDALYIADEEAKRNYAPREVKALDFTDTEKLAESRKRIDHMRKQNHE